LFPIFAFASLIFELKTYGFLHFNQFLFAFSVSSLDVYIYAFRSENEKFCSKSDDPLC